ncbi:protein-(glutamine-N5) methyltransferase, release factor-specific [Candidatus Epulonipiscioides saccharophilum]|nr:protein-(glutamine-N5) methyltransferase, release factor-specific [Epulopiscium sp. SCG-B10WGA-EpuloB]
MPTVREVLAYGTKILEENKIDNAGLDSRLLLMDLLGCNRHTLIKNSDKLIEENVVKEFFDYIERRKNHEPLQYITSYQEFMGLPFYVDRNVLIPRQDTELIVENLIEMDFGAEPKGLEIGVGSGCIAISLLHFMKKLKMTASDISRVALEITEKNALLNECSDRISLVESDLFENIKKIQYDFIVSNPPYISKEEMKTLAPEVGLFEPNIALTDNSDGLSFYRMIAEDAKQYLKNDGILALEIGYNQGEKVIKILKGNQYENIQLICDYNNKHRVIIATKGVE